MGSGVIFLLIGGRLSEITCTLAVSWSRITRSRRVLCPHACQFMLGLRWVESALLGAALSATGPVFAEAIVSREEVSIFGTLFTYDGIGHTCAARAGVRRFDQHNGLAPTGLEYVRLRRYRGGTKVSASI
jgi:hypothetical protein